MRTLWHDGSEGASSVNAQRTSSRAELPPPDRWVAGCRYTMNRRWLKDAIYPLGQPTWMVLGAWMVLEDMLDEHLSSLRK
jgi:hypothetical protein